MTSPDPAKAALAAQAHPLRSRLMTRLRLAGPATASELARELGTNSGATSYHLRALARAGLVRDTGAGVGRRREWEVTGLVVPHGPSEVGDDEDAASALAWLERDYVSHLAEQAQTWIDAEPTWPTPWRDACGTTDSMVLVTADQLAALNTEVAAVIEGYRRRGQGNPSARRVAVYSSALPLDVDRPPAGA